MKLTHLGAGLLLSLFITSSWALTPPKYLSVPQWQQCVNAVTKGSAQFICLPDSKPKNCLHSSWKTLKQQHLVDKCKKVVS